MFGKTCWEECNEWFDHCDEKFFQADEEENAIRVITILNWILILVFKNVCIALWSEQE